MIRIKDKDILSFLLSVPMHNALKPIAKYVVRELLAAEPEVEPVITSYYRKGDTGVHGTIPCRGLDFRSRTYKQETIDKVVEKANAVFIYDPSRPSMESVLFHDVGQGPHLHLQSHPNTIKR